jgi:hypothetical protein
MVVFFKALSEKLCKYFSVAKLHFLRGWSYIPKETQAYILRKTVDVVGELAANNIDSLFSYFKIRKIAQ